MDMEIFMVDLKQLVEKFNMNQHYTRSNIKDSIVEPLNRTIQIQK